MTPQVIFFDLGDTLGEAVVSPPPISLVAFQIFTYTKAILSRLQARKLRLGIVSNTGADSGAHVDGALKAAGILDYFDPALRIYSSEVGLKKDSPEIFRKAVDLAGKSDNPDACVYVGEDSTERSHAQAAGLQICPHPLLLEAVTNGEALRFVRISADGASLPWNTIREAERALVPLQVMGRSRSVLYAMAAESVLPGLAAAHLRVDFLGAPDLPLTADLFLQRDAAALMSSTERDLVVGAVPEGLLIALPPGRSLAEIHVESMLHGHTLKLVPDPQLIVMRPLPSAFRGAAEPEPPAPGDVKVFETITGDAIRQRVERYSGRVDLPDGRPVMSRHLAHPDNFRAVEAMAAELSAIGDGEIVVRLHRFSHLGRELFNIEGEISGQSLEMVLLTAHLDSTAANSPDYDEERDPAPGADDDASGIAAVLAAAECIAQLAKTTRPQRTIRFLLFNAEEEGLVGSRAYARLQRAGGAAIAGVFQMDMIGFNQADPRSWEIHLGCRTAPEIEAASLPLGLALRQITAQVSPNIALPQIYRSGPGIGDPADGRSDHSSFHAYCYPALVASEDFFVGPNPDSPDPESNLNYHQPGDTFVDHEYAADIARAVAAAAWQLAMSEPSPGLVAGARAEQENIMTTSREFDSRTSPTAASRFEAARSGAAPDRVNPITGTPFAAHATLDGSSQSLVDKAMSFVRNQGFAGAAGGSVDYVPDSVVQRTSTGAAAVNLHQFYRGIPVFQMTRTVRFDPQGRPTEALGDNAVLPQNINTEPRFGATDAVMAAAKFLAKTGAGETVRSQFGEEFPTPTVDVSNYRPETLFRFPLLPTAPTIVSKGPFENDVPAFLVVFVHPDTPRLAWYLTLTLSDYTDQFVVIVAADGPSGEILYSHSTMHRAKGRGYVYQFSPGIEPRREVQFPRPLSDYPLMPSFPIAMFPPDWLGDDGRAVGNSTIATLGASTTTLAGTPQGDGSFLFEPADENGDEQKMLNIFYFCNYMHDFLYILGFGEVSGNFQTVNLTNEGLGNDPVRARAHSGAVFGTANMSTGPDGVPPVMNMGLVVGSGRHTAFDFDVVAHEYVHGLTNRLVGGRLNANALDALQSGGMGEGWSDYYALTVQSFFQGQEKVVTGDWVVNGPMGIRRAPYDDDFPFSFGQLADFPEVHDIGEVWCAALMKMTRLIRISLEDDSSGYRLAWQLVTDALKLTPPNPTFLDARDAIFRTLDDMLSVDRLSANIHARVQAAIWQAFAAFGMGAAASCPDAGVDGIIADDSVPPPLIA